MNETTAGVRVLETPTSAATPARLDSPQPRTLPADAPVEKRGSVAGWLARSWATVLVVAGLGGLAFLGHQTDWTIPKFDNLFGTGQAATDDWCKEHGVPDSICVECNDKLLPRIPIVWCKDHGVHYCPFERPEIAQINGAIQIQPEDLERARRALRLKDRPKNNDECKKILRRIQFVSPAVMNKMGINPELVTRKPVEETLTVSGELNFEQPRVSSLSVPVSGRVYEVTEKGKLGAVVKKGDVLALVDALDVGKAKAEFQQALAQVDLKAKVVERQRDLVGTIVSEAQFQESLAALREAEIRLVGAEQALVNLGFPIRIGDVKDLPPEQLGKRLQFLGIPHELVKTLDPWTTTANLIPVRAARDGTVTAVKVAAGEQVDPTKTLFVVVDTSRMWLTLNIRVEDKKYLRIRDSKTGAPGQTVRFRADGSDGDVTGELVWVSTAVDDATRRYQVRADLPNPDGQLTAHTFGTGTIVLRAEKNAIVVPTEAIHWEGDCHVVFVQDKKFHEPNRHVFHVRTVRPGVRSGEYTEIIAGVLPGEMVATKNSAILRSELLKGLMGEG
jgi:cobalt-zinc-cadmium efflux system membrane fusion protein